MQPASQPLPAEMQAQGQQMPMAPQAPQQPQPFSAANNYGDEEDPSGQALENYLDFALSEANLAKNLEKKRPEVLDEMGEEVVRGYLEDEDSRTEWMTMNEDWIKMAMLIRENKTFPWPKASNVRYPLLATAAMQFTARAYPALVPSDGAIVKTKIVSKNPQDELFQAAGRISNHMSYQVLERMPNWEEDMDKLLMTMSISGVCFKKTYHNSIDGCHHSHIVYPENLCVNYHAKSLEKAYRKTEILKYNMNEVKEKINNDNEYLDVDLSAATEEKVKKEPIIAKLVAPNADKSTPHIFLACHTFWDLDGDGYEEPYIITVHLLTKKVVRIIARWDQDGVKKNEAGKIAKICPVEYFTDFPFIPNPDGSIYAIGFGNLLSPLNASADTIINQLVDAGTLNNLQAGFIGKGLRMRMGMSTFQPGEWKAVNATGDDIGKNIFPLPTKEPSGVLMSLLQLLITSGNQLASIAEIFVGKMPGQNTPATTTQEAVQQGMAVFTAIYKRVYRSLDKEFKKIYRLNKICPDIIMEESKLSGIQLQSSDYDLPEWIIIPGADPVGDSGTVKQQKLGMVGQLIQLGTIDPMAYTKRLLAANEIPNAEELLAQPQPPAPDPKQELIKAQTEQVQQKTQLTAQEKQQELSIKERLAALDEATKANQVNHAKQMQAIDQNNAEHSAKLDAISKVIKQHFDTQQQGLDLQGAAAKHALALQQKQESHQQAQAMKRANGAAQK